MSGLLNLLVAGIPQPAVRSVGAFVGPGANPTALLPALHVQGDILVIFGVGGSVAFTDPAGWTVGINQTAAVPRFAYWYKTDNGAETNVAITGGNANASVFMIAIKDTHGLDVKQAAVNTATTTAPAATSSITTTANGSLILSIWMMNQASTTFTSTPPAGTVQVANDVANGLIIYVASENQAVAGASTTRSNSVTAGTQTIAAAAVAFKP